MAHQYMPKILHDPHKNPPNPPPTYLIVRPLSVREKLFKKFGKSKVHINEEIYKIARY